MAPIVMLLFYVTMTVTLSIIVAILIYFGHWTVALIMVGVIGVIAFQDELPYWTWNWTTVGDDTRWGRAFDVAVWIIWLSLLSAVASSAVFDVLYS